MRLHMILAAGFIAIAAPASAQQVATLVAVPVPPNLPKAQLVKLLDASQPVFRKVPGLLRKYYSIGEDGRAGGIYLWKDRAAADAWYTDAWRADVVKRWGQPADVRYFEVPFVVDNSASQ